MLAQRTNAGRLEAVAGHQPEAEPSRHPALRKHAKERRVKLENRVADAITRFAGSMTFVYVHIVWFSGWILLGIESYPFGLLTMIVSLEAIFLSTFILISQNRADEKRQALADHQWALVQSRDAQIEHMISTSDEILRLTQAIHRRDPSRTTSRHPVRRERDDECNW